MEKELTSAMIWSLFDSLHEGVLIAETNGTILYLNGTAGELLNLTPEVASLQAAADFFTPPHSWEDCLTPPFATTILLENGRVIGQSSFTTDYWGYWETSVTIPLDVEGLAEITVTAGEEDTLSESKTLIRVIPPPTPTPGP